VLSLAPAGLITDIDGAISPIAPTPEDAHVSSVCRDALETLCSRMALVAAVSGRDALKAREMVGLEGMVYVGNHGLERWQDGGILIHEEARQYVPVVREVVEALGRGLDALGLIVEDKGVTASVHYRLSPTPAQARAAIFAFLDSAPAARGLLITEGKLVVEVRPPVRVDKGTSLRELVAEYGLRGVICLGDDSTDVDAFKALHALASEGVCAGLSLGVLGRNTPAALEQEADLLLSGVAEVEELLERIVEAYPIRRPPAS
jgi:trehalose 6-phosphate phosphatase